MKGKPRLCVDIDNVIARTGDVILKVIREHTDGEVDYTYEDITEFDIWRCRDRAGKAIRKEDWDVIHEEVSTPENILSVPPFPGAREGLSELSRAFEIHLVTSRLPHTRKATEEWLHGMDMPHDELHFAENGQKHNQRQAFFAAVEDYYDQGRNFALSGTPCYLITHPWNAGKPSLENLFWVEGWHELTGKLLREA